MSKAAAALARLPFANGVSGAKAKRKNEAYQRKHDNGCCHGCILDVASYAIRQSGGSLDNSAGARAAPSPGRNRARKRARNPEGRFSLPHGVTVRSWLRLKLKIGRRQKLASVAAAGIFFKYARRPTPEFSLPRMRGLLQARAGSTSGSGRTALPADLLRQLRLSAIAKG